MATEHVLIPKTKYEQLAKHGSTMDDASTQTDVHNEQSSDQYFNQQADSSDMSYNTDTGNPDYNSYDILQGFNPSEHKFVQPLLSLMKADPKTLTWDKHTGEIVFKNRRVKDSNVIELLKDSITDNLYPAGKMEFY